ncbi:hypothetical protein BT63DRAFT_420337 [Microthyrium microscopicum]|uniref:Actin-like ATPase domain-containing protein n=1 Tax=Microthyrium microscopicum TaxID=703497 RepID=A0A6A6UVK3_9PEZI|nr:hypothetical protein BT63DRAFT_420337 [Microthyrium microscopicum]
MVLNKIRDRKPGDTTPPPPLLGHRRLSSTGNQPRRIRSFNSVATVPPPLGNPASPVSPQNMPYMAPPGPPPGVYQTPAPGVTDEEPEALVAIGIDFGTTYSGVAWALSEAPDDIKTVTNWESYEYMNSDKEKAPTEIHYNARDANAPTAPDAADVTWGYGIPSDKEAVKWFKLLLLDDEDMETNTKNSAQVKRARELLRKVGRTATQAVADYLRFLWKHTIAAIEQDMGESAVEGTAFRVVITVPAVWTLSAIRKMRQAAELAGMLEPRLAGETTLAFVSEPEAAALATFEDMKARPNFNAGDCFVVCDAGGGTVDLISYKVHGASPMQLKECVEGKGKLCGAVFIDQDFVELMQQMVGEETWDNINAASIKKMMNTEWENGIKRGFDGSERTWSVTLPYECSQGREPYLRLSRGHVQEIFENVTSQIRALVNDQIRQIYEKEKKWPKAVVLVGGLGSCQYLFKLLKAENKGRDIEVYKSSGAKPWTAICRGAVHRALTLSNLPGIQVDSRISRLSYGIRFNSDFVDGVHREEDKWKSPYDGHFRARNQMQWYLHKGDEINSDHHVLKPWIQEHLLTEFNDQGKLAFRLTIYTCDLPDAPTRRTSDVKSLCQIKELLDPTNFPTLKDTQDRPYKRIEFSLEMNVVGSALEFAVIYQGKRIVEKNVKMELQSPSVISLPLRSAASTQPDIGRAR